MRYQTHTCVSSFGHVETFSGFTSASTGRLQYFSTELRKLGFQQTQVSLCSLVSLCSGNLFKYIELFGIGGKWLFTSFSMCAILSSDALEDMVQPPNTKNATSRSEKFSEFQKFKVHFLFLVMFCH
jgi:hypothetical protein